MVSNFGEALRRIRKKRGLTQEDLARLLNTSKQVVSRYENGQRTPKITLANQYAQILGVSLEELNGSASALPETITPISQFQTNTIPIIGSVAAGTPILAEESYDAYIDCPCKADYALRISGNSMNPNYLDGDVVFIRAQDNIDYDGQVLVVLLDDSATLKHVYRQSNGLLLVSDNPSYQPMFMPFEEYNTMRVLGKPIGFTRMFEE